MGLHPVQVGRLELGKVKRADVGDKVVVDDGGVAFNRTGPVADSNHVLDILAVNHGGLAEREFYVSTAGRHVRRGRISPTMNWNRKVTRTM